MQLAEFTDLRALADEILSCSELSQKIACLDRYFLVEQFWIERPGLLVWLSQLSTHQQFVFKQLIAMRQTSCIPSDIAFFDKDYIRFLEDLVTVDLFYKELGGLVGYQAKILECLQAQPDLDRSTDFYHAPSFIEISQENEFVEEAILCGIKGLAYQVEMYPLGGAADRLHLVDEKTQEELPAAKLLYKGRSLLEGLIRDVQAREFLYFKLFKKQIFVPIIMMTSHEKSNHQRVVELCQTAHWFGRPEESFRIFSQPSVPAVDEKGNWCLKGKWKLLSKPGGHGAIWKLAQDLNVFDWCKRVGKTKVLIRQINNPIAGVDYGLLAFAGVGFQKNYHFGFASCPRLLQAPEGINVLIEKAEGTLVLTNIEYCDFGTCRIQDMPLKKGDPYSQFSSNTNILFGDLGAISKAVQKHPFPGLLVNLKRTTFTDTSGLHKEMNIARLESTMQNIADVFVEPKGKKLETKKTFVTYNARHKTIATVKKAFVPGCSLQETAENCFYIQMQIARELLESYCGFHLPASRSIERYLEQGPEFVFLYHPALGPLYSILKEKLKEGVLAEGSELAVELTDLFVERLSLRGSLLIQADEPLGPVGKNHTITYSNQTSRCILRDVSVINQGVDWARSSPFWKCAFQRKESVTIHLEGSSQFIAEHVTFEGSHTIRVPDGTRLRAYQQGNNIYFEKELFQKEPLFLYSVVGHKIHITNTEIKR